MLGYNCGQHGVCMHVVALTVQGGARAAACGRRAATVQDCSDMLHSPCRPREASHVRFTAEMQRTEQVQGVRKGQERPNPSGGTQNENKRVDSMITEA